MGGSRARLGLDTFLGRSVLVAQVRFALRPGPLPIATYREFLPDGSKFRALRDLVRFAAEPNTISSCAWWRAGRT